MSLVPSTLDEEAMPNITTFKINNPGFFWGALFSLFVKKLTTF